MQSFEWRKLHGTTIFHEDTLVKREDAGSFLESGLTIATDQKAPLKRKRCSRSMQKPSESRHPFFEASARSISCWWRPCRMVTFQRQVSDRPLSLVLQLDVKGHCKAGLRFTGTQQGHLLRVIWVKSYVTYVYLCHMSIYVICSFLSLSRDANFSWYTL